MRIGGFVSQRGFYTIQTIWQQHVDTLQIIDLPSHLMEFSRVAERITGALANLGH
ncbi:MAG: hypothetical protein P8O70_04050 [SAR324 cluster bacterium]|nr:hypothetical protein [SAR324 cluster bacterium]